ncbi:MAG: hypothetical protein QM640_04840, partial [Niabella sp.]
ARQASMWVRITSARFRFPVCSIPQKWQLLYYLKRWGRPKGYHRSDFFHGNSLKNINDQTYFDIDEIVRQAVLKVIFKKHELFNSGKELLDKYLLGLTLGLREADKGQKDV